MVEELPCEVPQLEHVLDDLVHEGPFRRVVAGNCAELCLCRAGHPPRAENLRPLRAGGAPRGDPYRRLIPGREVLGRFLHCLAVVWPEEP